MRATVSIEDKLLKELMNVSKDKDSSEAIKQALKEYITWKKWESILTFGNRFEWETDVLPKLDRLTLKRYRHRFSRKSRQS